ncbi:FAD-dependent oxidoreductase [Vulcaniibacterium tengchongense]|uniref:Glycine/D-amino acid oxidase-like deaminating enzyme n=1 Tax=Vulcaniibacterium tengchongense TaxID=1273429 RepID=A0A3N4V9U7_9GAMM|nr:FAD-dependent oxidoreductase [Vulcaniibacterium tengchongense]RPE79776.1 glycine/D-amino acid oxidase-like deaminating enzyme [Vulcaniibacterium tengchongense]
MKSVWMTQDEATPLFPSLSGRLDADTAVIGGGIAGVATALWLSEAGQRVALVEADRIGAGNTGLSTGNLYGTLSQGLAALRRKWSADALREAVALRLEAVARIERDARRFGIDCDFARRPQYLCVRGDDPQRLRQLEEEYEAAAEAGLHPRWQDPPPLGTARALTLEAQAQFNPFLYVRGLAAVLHERGVRLFERSPVVEVDAGEGRVRTAAGEVRARDVVIATHSPIGFNLVQAEMEVYREYGLSARLADDAYPQGIHWIRDEARSVRSYRHRGEAWLVIVGEKHKTGEPEPGVDYPRRLQEYARAHFRVAEFGHAWSAQQFRSADGLPYIGRSAHRNVHIATGFGADGLTWGAVAAAILGELILGREPRGAELLSPRRFTPAKSARTWATENAAVVRHLVGDRLAAAEVQGLDQVPPGAGRIVEVDGRKCAVYRDPEGGLTVLSPVCPHLKCHVAWNPEAGSWDCPCHGSRFRPDGSVLEGPATAPLARVAP